MMAWCVREEWSRRWREWQGYKEWEFAVDSFSHIKEGFAESHIPLLWPTSLLCLHYMFIRATPPSPSPLHPGLQATRVGSSHLYLNVCVFCTFKYVSVLYSTSKVRPFLWSENILTGPHNFKTISGLWVIHYVYERPHKNQHAKWVCVCVWGGSWWCHCSYKHIINLLKFKVIKLGI